MKINWLHIKRDLIKEFQEKQTSFKLIVLKLIQAYLKSDRWHLKFNFISSVICIRWISSIALNFEVQSPAMRNNPHRSAMAPRRHSFHHIFLKQFPPLFYRTVPSIFWNSFHRFFSKSSHQFLKPAPTPVFGQLLVSGKVITFPRQFLFLMKKFSVC